MPLFVIFDQDILAKHPDIQRPPNVSPQGPLQPSDWQKCTCRGISLLWNKVIGRPQIKVNNFHVDLPLSVLDIATAEYGYKHTEIIDQWDGQQLPARYKGLVGKTAAFTAVITRSSPHMLKMELQSNLSLQEVWEAYWVIREAQLDLSKFFANITPLDLTPKKPS